MSRRKRGQNTYPGPRPAVYKVVTGMETVSSCRTTWLTGWRWRYSIVQRRVHSEGGVSRDPIHQRPVPLKPAKFTMEDDLIVVDNLDSNR
jgi:hypothetical protein